MELFDHLGLVTSMLLASSAPHAEQRYDIIDMHFHADRPDAEGPPGSTVCAP